jgi:hypothetical protein
MKCKDLRIGENKDKFAVLRKKLRIFMYLLNEVTRISF